MVDWQWLLAVGIAILAALVVGFVAGWFAAHWWLGGLYSKTP